MDYVFPAVFHKNEDGTYTISYPDLEGCISEGKSLENALYMAQSALTQWINYITDKKQHIPKASTIEEIKVNNWSAAYNSASKVPQKHLLAPSS